MVRTQVYLTEHEKKQLDAIAATQGITQRELIRQAIDDLIGKHGDERRLAALRQARGIWKGRKDLLRLKRGAKSRQEQLR